MSENDYIKTRALGVVQSAISVLLNLNEKNLSDVILDGEYSKVLPTLYDWQDRLSEQIEIENTK